MWWPLGHLCRLVSELRCRQSSANEERLVRLQTVLKPMSLGGMDDGLHRRTVGLKFEDYLMVILFVLLVVQYPFWWCKNTKKNMTWSTKRCWMLFCMEELDSWGWCASQNLRRVDRYIIPASGTLPAELLTVVQVLLMSQHPGLNQPALIVKGNS